MWNGDHFFMAQYGRTDPPSLYWPTLLLDTGISMEFAANGYTDRMSPEEATDDTIEKLEDELPSVLEQFQ